MPLEEIQDPEAAALGIRLFRLLSPDHLQEIQCSVLIRQDTSPPDEAIQRTTTPDRLPSNRELSQFFLRLAADLADSPFGPALPSVSPPVTPTTPPDENPDVS